MVDFLSLKDGRVITLNDECICVFPSKDAFYEDTGGDALHSMYISSSIPGRESVSVAKKPEIVLVEAVIADFDGNGMVSVGASAALQAMAVYWNEHLADGMSFTVISEDIDGLRSRLGIMRAEIMTRIAIHNFENPTTVPPADQSAPKTEATPIAEAPKDSLSILGVLAEVNGPCSVHDGLLSLERQL
jgi:hypothetical protein